MIRPGHVVGEYDLAAVFDDGRDYRDRIVPMDKFTCSGGAEQAFPVIDPFQDQFFSAEGTVFHKLATSD